jgi:hypothetical protein
MAQDPPYYNSNEPGCDGSNPDILFAEDFEDADQGGGHWYSEDYDTAVTNGGVDTRTKGWGGTIYANPITPAGAHRATEGIGGTYCGTHGITDGSTGGRNMAEHGISTDGTNATSVVELYVRWYQKWKTGYIYSGEKVLTFNHIFASGGIKWGNVHINQGIQTPSTTGILQWQGVDGNGVGETADNIVTISNGQWMCTEIRMKLSTTTTSADGILQIWCDACGTDGLSPPASQTLRYSTTTRNFHRQNADQKIASLWWENWANSGDLEGSTGESLIDNIVVSVSPIGFITEGGGGYPSNLLIARGA